LRFSRESINLLRTPEKPKENVCEESYILEERGSSSPLMRDEGRLMTSRPEGEEKRAAGMSQQ